MLVAYSAKTAITQKPIRLVRRLILSLLHCTAQHSILILIDSRGMSLQAIIHHHHLDPLRPCRTSSASKPTVRKGSILGACANSMQDATAPGVIILWRD